MDEIINCAIKNYNEKITDPTLYIIKFDVINYNREKTITMASKRNNFHSTAGFKYHHSLLGTYTFSKTHYFYKIFQEIIKVKEFYYFNSDNYKYKLYLILRNVFGKDLSIFILQIMIKENKKSIDNTLHWYYGLCEKCEQLDNNDDKRECFCELFTIFDDLNEFSADILILDNI